MKTILFISIAVFCFVAGAGEAAYTPDSTGKDYCAVPPYIEKPQRPHALIVMDHSGSMQNMVYLPCNPIYNNPNTNCQNSSDAAYQYSAARDYYGYFDKNAYYKYASDAFQVNASCTDTDRIGSRPAGGETVACISGNLLNWATSTRVDISRKVMTGGRTRTSGGDELESEGAVGSYTDTNLRCKFAFTATSASNRYITITNTNTGDPSLDCKIPLTTQKINVKIPDAATNIRGVYQDFRCDMDFSFMIFNDSYQGKIVGGKQVCLANGGTNDAGFIQAMNTQTPYGSTPTGSALYEAKEFFMQATGVYPYANNGAYVSKANGGKDPFYDSKGGGSVMNNCRKAFVLLFTDGAYNMGEDPMKPARQMRITDLRPELPGTQNVTTYSVYAFGNSEPQGKKSLMTTSIFGGFGTSKNDTDPTWPYPFTSYPSDSKTVTYPLSQCNPADPPPVGHTWDTKCGEWDKNRSGIPYNYFEADDGAELELALRKAFYDMLMRVSSGTAASLLASSEGSGASLVQAVFYPVRLFGTTELYWSGVLQNLWYYIDPFFGSSSIREDSSPVSVDPDTVKTLDIANDRFVTFYYDAGDQTMARRYTPNADGTRGTEYNVPVVFEDVMGVWEAGRLLHIKNPADRTIYYAKYDAAATEKYSRADFATGALTTDTSLQSLLQAGTATDAQAIINFTRGTDQPSFASFKRRRTVSYETTVNKEWKLGDIVSSTPRVQSSVALNNYHHNWPDGYNDLTYREFISRDAYKNRGMVYVGANDGMLHAFKLGKFELKWTGQGNYEKSKLSGSDMGQEAWAFIPRNALPYLKYIANPAYCHIYTVDLPAFVFDASTGSSSTSAPGDTRTANDWKTYLIGGMGFGGAAKSNSETPCTTSTCVRAPVVVGGENVGFSSYFALDVTDPTNPAVKWEFANSSLGYSLSGPTIVRIGDRTTNGNWYIVLASGPTGPISNLEFQGQSNQTLKIFILDLKTGALLRTIDTGIANAFAGTMFASSLDTDRWKTSSSGNYSDDVIYIGYTKKDTSTGNWTKGGVVRIQTFNSTSYSTWPWSHVIEDIGPVTTGIAKLQDRQRTKSLWLYFGTGRFFKKLDDLSETRRIYGVKEPCYDSGTNTMKTSSCSLTVSSLEDRNTASDAPLAEGNQGWYVDLSAGTTDPETGMVTGTERVVTDPLATFNGAVFFTTFQPNEDPCGFGGNTALWALRYDTAGSMVGSGGSLGKALLQVSTGVIEQVEMDKNVLSDRGYRKSVKFMGAPPRGQGLTVVIPPPAIQKILQIRER